MDWAWCSMLCDFGDWTHVMMRVYSAWSGLARHAATGASSVTACGTTTLLPIASGSWSSGSTGAKPKTCRGRASLPPTFGSPAGVAGAPQQQSGGSNGNRGGGAAARRRTLP